MQQLDELDALVQRPEITLAFTLLGCFPFLLPLIRLDHLMDDLDQRLSLPDSTHVHVLERTLNLQVLLLI